MDLSENKAIVPVMSFSPHPILLAKDRELIYAHFLPNETVLEFLKRAGIFQRLGGQAFSLTVNGRRLPRTMWAYCRPKPGTRINLYAVVHGGDGSGKKNPVAMIAMIALTIAAPQIGAAVAGAGTTGAAIVSAFVMVGGGLIINSLFPPPKPELSKAQDLGGNDSPTYAIQGGSNRMRRYEPMPKIVGVHRIYPDFGAVPYSEFEGEEQIGYYVFNLGYNVADLSDFKIGDTPIANFEGVEMEISGPDGVLTLFPGNVDSIAGIELLNALGFVSRTSSPNATSHAVEISGSLFFLSREGTTDRAVEIDIEYRPVGAGAWIPLEFEPDTVPAEVIVEGVARIPALQYEQGLRKEITAQDVVPGVTVLSASLNSTVGVGSLGYFHFTTDVGRVHFLRWVPAGASPGIAPTHVGDGGNYLIKDISGTQNILVHVDPSLLPGPGAVITETQEVTVGSTVIPGRILIRNANTAPLRRTFLWHTAQGQYEVRVKRQSPDEESIKASSQIIWSQLRTYQPEPVDYTGQLRIALKIRASALLQGTLNQFSCVARAKCRVWGEEEDFDLIETGDAQGGTADSLTLKATSNPLDGSLIGKYLRITAGAGAGQFRPISAYEWRRNDLTKSSAVDHANWTKDNAPTITANFASSADGTMKAERVQMTDGTLQRYHQTVNGYAGKTMCFAVKMRSLTGVNQTISMHLREVGFGTTYVTENKTVTPTEAIFYISAAIPGGSAGVLALMYESGAVQNWDIAVSEHQVNEGSTPSLFVETDAVAGNFPVATVEDPWSVNDVARSEEIDNAYWGKSNLTATADSLTRITTSNASANRNSLTFLPGHTYKFSCEAKKKSAGDRLGLRIQSYPNRGGAVFNLDAGTVVGNEQAGTGYVATSSIQSVGDGWYLCTIEVVIGTTAATGVLFGPTDSTVAVTGWEGGNAVLSDCFIRKMHLRHISASDEYIKTVASAITRPDATSDYELLDAWPVRHTSNPAWWFLDVARGKIVNGLRVWGAALADSRIDIDGLKAFAAFCTSTGQEMNAVFDQQMSVHNMLNAIALMGRGTHTLSTGKHGVLWDAPDLPVTALFGMHNIVAGTFVVEYVTGDIADVIEGWYYDVEKEQRDFVRCFVPGATTTDRVRKVELFGRTSRQLAIEDTNLYAAANAYRARRYRWQADWEMHPVPRGDVVEIGHDLLSMLSGRFIEGGNTTTLKLSKKVPLYSEGSHIAIRKPDATFAVYPVVAGAGETDTLTLVSPLPFNPWADPDGYPPYDYRWHYGPLAVTGRRVKIESLKPISDKLVNVTAIDENPLYYAAKNNPPDVRPDIPVVGELELTGITITEDGVRAGNGYLARVFVVWDVVGDYGFADVRVSINGAPMTTFAQDIRGRSCSFTVSDFSTVEVEVIAWTSVGKKGKSVSISDVHDVNYAGQNPPSNVSDFTIEGSTFRWMAPPEVDIVGYIIRYHYGENTSVINAAQLHQGLLSSSPATFPNLPAGVVTFLLTAVDAAGLESLEPALIIKDLGDPISENIVEEIDFKDLSWPGTLTGGTEIATNLEADDITDFYGSDPDPFYGADLSDFYEDQVYAEMRYETPMIYFASEWLGSTVLIYHQVEGDVIRIEYRTTGGESFYGSDGDDFYGPDSEAFFGSDGDWRPWTGAITYENGDLQLAVVTSNSPIQGIIYELSIVIDVPDIDETLENVVTAPGGTRLVLTKPFKAIKNIQLTVQADGGSARSARILDRNVELGPLVECIDSTLASVSGLLDARVKGR